MGRFGPEGRFKNFVGAELRRARKAKGLTLEDVEASSRGRFKPSSVGGYERGERSLSLERFCDLSNVYGVPADHLLSSALNNMYPDRRRRIALDLARLRLVDVDRARLMAELAHRIRDQRGDYLSNVITLRSGDLEALALSSSIDYGDLLRNLRPAVHTKDDRGSLSRRDRRLGKNDF